MHGQHYWRKNRGGNKAAKPGSSMIKPSLENIRRHLLSCLLMTTSDLQVALPVACRDAVKSEVQHAWKITSPDRFTTEISLVSVSLDSLKAAWIFWAAPDSEVSAPFVTAAILTETRKWGLWSLWPFEVLQKVKKKTRFEWKKRQRSPKNTEMNQWSIWIDMVYNHVQCQ